VQLSSWRIGKQEKAENVRFYSLLAPDSSCGDLHDRDCERASIATVAIQKTLKNGSAENPQKSMPRTKPIFLSGNHLFFG
jgi:hypothetical protein